MDRGAEVDPLELAAAAVGSHAAQQDVAGHLLDHPEHVTRFLEALDAVEHPAESALVDVARHVLEGAGPEALGLVADMADAAPTFRPAPEFGPAADSSWGTFPYTRDTIVAAMASATTADALVALVADRGSLDPDTGLRIAHHLIALGHQLPQEARWPLNWAVATGHPLALLPDQLLDVERGLPSRTAPGPRPEPDLARAAHGEELGSVVTGFGPGVPVDSRNATAAVRDWPVLSNGRIHVAGCATGDRPSFPDDQGGRLHGHHLGLSTVVEPVPAELAVTMIYECSAVGPAYGGTPGAGTSRLRTWQTVAGLTGTRWPARITELAAIASSTSWFRVPSPAPAIWYLCLLAHHHDQLVLLEAYDSD